MFQSNYRNVSDNNNIPVMILHVIPDCFMFLIPHPVIITHMMHPLIYCYDVYFILIFTRQTFSRSVSE